MSNTSRTADLAKIHLAKKALGLDDATYRQIIRTAGEAASGSAADLSPAGRARVLAHFHACGWRAVHRVATRRPAGDPQEAKILALWGALERLGALREPDEKGLDHFIQRQTGITTRRFLRAAHKRLVIEALKGWVEREQRKQARPA